MCSIIDVEMNNKKLKPRQYEILEFIKTFQDIKKYPPAIRDIQSACNLSSTSVVDYNLKILERDGYIKRDKTVSRSIEIIQTDTSDNTIAVLGYIAAGEPLPLTTEDKWGSIEPLEIIDLPKTLVKDRNEAYALKVKGTSMIDALVDDGDIIIIKPVHTVRDGDMVVAWLQRENAVTLKRLFREPNRIKLQPANINMSPIYVDPDNIQIQGKVIAVIRNTE